MPRKRRRPPPVQVVLRFYPGRDDDLIRWLDGLEAEPYGAKTQAMKDVLRRGLGSNAKPGDPKATGLDLGEVRRVVEAAVASALGRLEIQGVSQATSELEEEDDEVEELLGRLGQSLLLDED